MDEKNVIVVLKGEAQHFFVARGRLTECDCVTVWLDITQTNDYNYTENSSKHPLPV